MTLVEVLLALALTAALAGLFVGGLSGKNERRAFRQAVRDFETTLRMTRASAANEGRRFRVRFGNGGADEAAAVYVEYEPEPLSEPGQFVAYEAVGWSSDVPTGRLRVLSSRRIGTAAYRDASLGLDQEPDETDDVQFRPDGSCDSAIIELAPPDEADALRASVRVDGLAGTIRAFVLTYSELETHREAIEAGTYEPDTEESTGA